MPLLSDGSQISGRIADFADKLEIAITAEINKIARLLPDSALEQQGQLNTIKKTFAICTGGGMGCRELVVALPPKVVCELVGQLVCLAGMLGIDYAGALNTARSTPDLDMEGLN